MVDTNPHASLTTSEAMRRDIRDRLFAAKLSMTARLCDASAMLDGYGYRGQERRKAWREAKRRACDWWSEQVDAVRAQYPDEQNQHLINELVLKVFPDYESYRQG